MNELALFAGIGGGILGTQLLGHRCVCAVENDPHAQSVLLARQNDGYLPPFPIWDDVTTFDGRPWRGIVDLVSGGFPCQDISIAGKQQGLDGERSGLWREMSRIIGEVCPRFVFIENSPELTKLGLSEVLSDLAQMGYDAVWGCIGASTVGADHERQRIWIVGQHTDKVNALREARPAFGTENPDACEWTTKEIKQEWYGRLPELGAVSTLEGEFTYAGAVRALDGIPHRMDRSARLGNAQVPAVARLAFALLVERFAEQSTPAKLKKWRIMNDIPWTS